MPNDDPVGSRLNADRRDLLDLSLRNPLLNYRPRLRGLEIVGESSPDVFRILVREGRTMTFLHDPSAPEDPDPAQEHEQEQESKPPEAHLASEPVPEPPGELTPEPAQEPSRDLRLMTPADEPVVPTEPEAPASEPSTDLVIEPSPDLSSEPAPVLAPTFLPTSTTDLKLQTALSAPRLESRLLAIYLAARTSIEEQGVNTLFLAQGMLSWYESDAPQKRLNAPLILVPVELARTSARERFRLRHDGEDLGVNLSLAERLKAEFQIVLPAMPDADDLDVAAYFSAVAEAVQDRPKWAVQPEVIALGFFSFGKFLMYLDLDEQSWPEEARPAGHPILKALLGDGFQEPAAEVGEDESIDRWFDPRENRQVVDADSTQMLALLDADRGRNLVIQGPPGTGKSQTITNLIAEAAGKGKKVLFVAEKMAALEVVKRRLDAAGLGGACLELHSHKTKKKGVLDELRRTLELTRPRLGPIDDDLRMLTEVRDRLNAYSEAVNTPIAASGVTPHEAFGEFLNLRDGSTPAAVTVAPPRPDLPAMLTWTGFDFKRRLDLVEQLQARLAQAGVPRDHPFFGSRRTMLLASEEEQLRGLIDQARRTTDRVRDTAIRLAGQLGFDPPEGPDRLAILLRAAHWAGMEALRTGADLRTEDWGSRTRETEELLKDGQALADLHQRHDESVIPEAWDQDLLETRHDLNVSGRRWWRFVSPTYWRAKRRVAMLCRRTPPRGLEEQLALIDAIMAARRYRETVRRHEGLAARLFGPQWRGERSNWADLATVARTIVELHADVREGLVPSTVVDLLATRPNLQGLQALTSAVEEALTARHAALQSLFTFLDFDETTRFGPGGYDRLGLQDQSALLALWASRTSDLRGLAAWNFQVNGCRNEGLDDVVALADWWPEARLHLAPTFRRWWYEGLLEQAYRERPPLAGFEGTSQDQAVAKFRELDRLALRHAQARLAHDHWQGLPRKGGGGQLAVLRREFEKKSRHIPVRQLMVRAGNAVQAIKPVFMMSPMSVASYLPPGALQFDLVVFDEASQVRPVDALGALLRGRNAVVVGDSRQLPPTNFFDRLTGGTDDGEDDEALHDVESILGLFVSQGAPQRMLRWHYRSRHESLIAVSNHEFYDNRLVVFPSPDAGRSESGLVFRHLPQTHYDRGRTRTNPGEAEEVARAVLAFARDQLARPESSRQTLGVAAFSVSQMQAIIDQLERLRREEPACEEFFATGTVEPFFVKNLENVQGDERDVIFISVGYGRTADGNLAMNFGPLNNEGGERRLNVLITRARRRCEVFTNLTAGDIDLARTSARGVQALKAFFTYAQTGMLESVEATGAESASSFERTVQGALTAAGHRVRERIGSSGFRLEMGVVDPDRPSHYQLGIECDGPVYQSARSARDRDRLRQQVLENLGWKLHRIWSTEWFRDPEGELSKACSAINAAQTPPVVETPGPESPPQEASSEPKEADDPIDGELIVDSAAIPAYQLAALDVKLGGQELHEVPPRRMASWVIKVVQAEGPILASEATRRLADAAGVKRIGTRIQAAFDLALDLSIRQGSLRREGDFLWSAEMNLPPLRDRSGLPTAARKLDLIAPEEIGGAVERVVAEALGMEPTEVASAACRLLGFPRVSDEMRQRIDAIVEDLVRQNRLIKRGDHLLPPDPA
ncbi:AAA domain-containing protein [Singulisphaera sp. GP187]|uniref:DUF3320 domain-containing protein n=1 Tax=Singulisphaera sp. GP187 TaxID=1882752 RepID=UPI0009287F9D|nr:DUF3320 domain-containing protein [Singulisphaera sp. GP187]SIN72078.1 AAA domain-containing protein [Singulisphaera sp. GP187]